MPGRLSYRVAELLVARCLLQTGLVRAIAVIVAFSAACGSQDNRGQLIATLPGKVQSLQASSTRLYATSDPDEVYQIDPSGGARKISTPFPGVARIAVAGDQIYTPAAGGIAVFDAMSASLRVIAPDARSVGELLADDGRVYWVEHSDSPTGSDTVHAAFVDGSAGILLGNGRYIFQDDEAFCWQWGGIVCAPKSNLSTTFAVAPSGTYGITAARATGGYVYWSPLEGSSPRLLSTRADGSDAAPALLATFPLSLVSASIQAIEVLAGSAHLETFQNTHEDYDEYLARILRVDSGNLIEVARAEKVSSRAGYLSGTAPAVVAGAGGLFWAVGRDVYRIK
jgi:hypothetical protein